MGENDQVLKGTVVVGLGEALFDCFEDRRLLGGAPVNFTVHVQRLLAAHGGQGALVSRVGDDPLGREVVAAIENRGVRTDLVQVDAQRPTGRVNVTVSADGQPTYEIAEGAAWDYLTFEESLQRLAGRCSAVCFGSLAQRYGASRETISRFLRETENALRMFDVNLRQDYYDRNVLDASLAAATAVKLNCEELSVVCELLFADDQPAADPDKAVERLLNEYRLELLALTRGADGTVVYVPGKRVEGTPVAAERRANADSVGAGDACCAGIVYGTLLQWPLEQTVELANRLGAFVASHAGATPELPDELLKFAALNRPGELGRT